LHFRRNKIYQVILVLIAEMPIISFKSVPTEDVNSTAQQEKGTMNQEDELIRENDKALINTQNAVQALQERVGFIPIELYPEDFVTRLKKLASDIDSKRDM
jgi:hypothetical protein